MVTHSVSPPAVQALSAHSPSLAQGGNPVSQLMGHISGSGRSQANTSALRAHIADIACACLAYSYSHDVNLCLLKWKWITSLAEDKRSCWFLSLCATLLDVW